MIFFEGVELLKIKDDLSLLANVSNKGNSRDGNLYVSSKDWENFVYESFGCSLNISGKDVAIDLVKNDIGIGAKTIMEKENCKSEYEKISEHNRDRDKYKELLYGEQYKEVACSVSLLRNERLDFSIKEYDLNPDLLYYIMLVRRPTRFQIIVSKMNYIDIENINVFRSSPSGILFTDGKEHYCFEISKSVINKRFDLTDSFIEVPLNMANYKNNMKKFQDAKKRLLKYETREEVDSILGDISIY